MLTMKNIALALTMLLCSVAAGAFTRGPGFGNSESFNDGWLFILNPEGDSFQTVNIDESDWTPVDLPHDWSILQPMDSTLAAATGFLPGGIGWYRKHFEISDSLPEHYVYFEGIYNRSEIYLNGHKIGERPNGYISTLYDLTPYLQPGDNVLAVKVDHSREADSRWYTGSGIYRDAWLVAAPSTRLAPWGIGFSTVDLTPDSAVVDVNVQVVNPQGHTLNVALLNPDGTEAARSSLRGGEQNNVKMKVNGPHAWSVDRPNLYTLQVDLLDAEGRTLDSSRPKVGLRTVRFDADKGFFLNDSNMKIKGVCIHHDAGALGAAVPPQVWVRRLRNLKDIGVNALRMSHNPQAPVVYDIADSLGLMVMDEASDEWEFPKRKWIKGWNKGEPGYDGTYDFFEQWIETDVADMVRRDRLHPSVILWSIGNEVDYPNDPYSHPILDGASLNQPVFGGYKPDAPNAERIGHIAKRLAAVVRSIDTSRPVTGALAGVLMSNQTEYPQAVDVVGYNYTEDRYDLDHELYPRRVIYGSENSSTFDAWRATRDRDFIPGQFIWTGTDYLGESNGWPARGFYTGLLDFGSFTKPRGHFRASLWKTEPTIYIGTYALANLDPVLHPAEAAMHLDTSGPWLSIDAEDTWNYNAGDSVRVVCYTNTPMARLKLNGRVVGDVKPYDDQTGIIYWDIPFSPGELAVEGLDSEDNVVASYIIRTTGEPVALTARVEENAAEPGLKHVVVEVIDSEGNKVHDANNLITCVVEGDTRLLALENSDNNDTGVATSNPRRAYHGRLLAYLMRGTGDAAVTFTSPGLRPAVVAM